MPQFESVVAVYGEKGMDGKILTEQAAINLFDQLKQHAEAGTQFPGMRGYRVIDARMEGNREKGKVYATFASDAQPEKKDTSPMIRSRRIKREIRIEESNNPPSSVFDTMLKYPSDSLPEWFAGLQSIVEDETFTSMTINLGDKVRYNITIARPLEDNQP